VIAVFSESKKQQVPHLENWRVGNVVSSMPVDYSQHISGFPSEPAPTSVPYPCCWFRNHEMACGIPEFPSSDIVADVRSTETFHDSINDVILGKRMAIIHRVGTNC
jgi:hypothetical protein